MNPKIHLLYFSECPNWKKAQENLCAASNRLGKKLEWEEVNLESSDCPQSWRGFPSPTILINRIDIQSGRKEMEGSIACRFGGVSSPDLIISKINLGGERP